MTSYYTDLPFMARSSYSYCMGLPFMVDSIDSSAVYGQLQFFSDAAYDGFIKLQFEKFTTVAKTVLKFLLLSYFNSFVYVFKLIDFRRISKKCISWRILTKFQQGRQSRVGQSFAIE